MSYVTKNVTGAKNCFRYSVYKQRLGSRQKKYIGLTITPTHASRLQ